MVGERVAAGAREEANLKRMWEAEVGWAQRRSDMLAVATAGIEVVYCLMDTECKHDKSEGGCCANIALEKVDGDGTWLCHGSTLSACLSGRPINARYYSWPNIPCQAFVKSSNLGLTDASKFQLPGFPGTMRKLLLL